MLTSFLAQDLAALIIKDFRWLLAVSATAQVSLCLVQSAAFLASNMHGFVTLGGGERATAYFFVLNSPLAMAQQVCYDVNVSPSRTSSELPALV